jgi:hypothetical protein
MRGVSNKITAAKQLNPLYRGTLNAFCAISDAGLTQINKALSLQSQNNPVITSATPNGVLAGSVVAIVDAATVGPALAAAGKKVGIVGLAVRNAAGEPYESTNSEASGGLTYLHGTNTLVEVAVYEATEAAAPYTALTWTPGEALYASQNGLLTNVQGLVGKAADAAATVVAVLVDPPSTNNPVMTVQLRV